MKRWNESPTVPDEAIEPESGDVDDDMIVATPKHHVLDEFAARPRLRLPKPRQGGVKE